MTAICRICGKKDMQKLFQKNIRSKFFCLFSALWIEILLPRSLYRGCAPADVTLAFGPQITLEDSTMRPVRNPSDGRGAGGKLLFLFGPPPGVGESPPPGGGPPLPLWIFWDIFGVLWGPLGLNKKPGGSIPPLNTRQEGIPELISRPIFE